MAEENRAVQLTLNLKTEQSYLPEDYIVSSCNKEAYDYVSSWPQWHSHCCIVYGPPQSGKNHLSKVWQHTIGNKLAIILKTDLRDEEGLFHLYNTTREQGTDILLLLEKNIAAHNITLPDLKSRLMACPQFKLDLPDDQMVRMLLMKHCVDCHLPVDDNHLEFIAKRVTRNYSEIRDWVYGLAEYLAARKRKVSLVSIREYMEDNVIARSA